MNPSSHRLRAVLSASLVAGFVLSPVAALHAQTPVTPPAVPAAPQAPLPPPPPDHRRGPGFMHPGGGPHGMERLKTSLRLDAKQAALWDRAAAQMKPPADARERMKAQREHLGALLDDPDFDPHKLAAEMDAEQAERAARMKAVRDSWIALYDSLNPVQRGQVREFLRGHMMHGGPGRFPHGPGPMGEADSTRPAQG